MGGRRRAKGRRLSPDDRAVWEHVIRSVTPMRRGESALPLPAPLPAPQLRRPAQESSAAPEPRPPGTDPTDRRPAGARAGGGVSVSHAAPPTRPVGRPEPGLDRRTAERLRRGDREPDARIDLHGMTTARAHIALDRFMGEAVRQGARLVLVITGKGARPHRGEEAPFMAGEGGVLRRAAPDWLRRGPHAGRIVGIYAAHRRHGGAGAFYVYLKKPGG